MEASLALIRWEHTKEKQHLVVKAEKNTECSWASCLSGFHIHSEGCQEMIWLLRGQASSKVFSWSEGWKSSSGMQKHGRKAGNGGIVPFAPLLLNPELEYLLQTRSLLTGGYLAEPGQHAEVAWFGMTWLYHQIYPKLDPSLIWSTFCRPSWMMYEQRLRTQPGHRVPSEWCCGVPLQE